MSEDMVAQMPGRSLGRVQCERHEDRVDDRQTGDAPPEPAMIDHASIGVRDLAAAAAFYEPVLATIGLTRLVVRATTVGFGKTYPELWLNARPSMAGPAPTTAAISACAQGRVSRSTPSTRPPLALGANDDGAPGPRPEYTRSYYAAFIRDADGNRIEVVTFLTGTRPPS